MADETQLTPAQRLCPTCNLEVAGTLSRCPRDGTQIVHVPPPKQTGGLPANIIEDAAFRGKYEFIGTIGSGGMGVIYKARQLLLNKFVAIKMVHSHLIAPKVFYRFEVEARAAGKLSHPNIVAVHDYGMTSAGQPYMVMDYIQGFTLADVIKEHGPISEIRFHRLFKQICDALSLAHDQGVLHRDLKPSNIMLVKNDKGLEDARVMDFGIAKILHDPDVGVQFETKTGETVGSPPYMSPEQSMGRPTDARSDLYSLGCLMYEALSGTPPFVGMTALDTMAKHISDPPLPLSKQPLCGSVDPELEFIVMRLLKKSPEDRYQSVLAVLADLVTVSKGGTVRTAIETKRAPKTKAIVIAAIAMLLPIFAFCIWNSLGSPDPVPQKPAAGTTTTDANNQPVVDTGDTIGKPTKEDSLDMGVLLMKSKAKVYIQDLIDGHKEINFSDVGNMYTVTKEDLEPLASPKAAYVTWLKLRNLNLTDEDIQPINARRLKYLNLDNNKVQKLNAIRGMTSLRLLSLSETNVDRDGLIAISGIPDLSILYLDHNMIKDQDLPLLYDMQHLTKLDLRFCPLLTAKAVRELREHLPKSCEIDSEFIKLPKAPEGQ